MQKKMLKIYQKVLIPTLPNVDLSLKMKIGFSKDNDPHDRSFARTGKSKMISRR